MLMKKNRETARKNSGLFALLKQCLSLSLALSLSLILFIFTFFRYLIFTHYILLYHFLPPFFGLISLFAFYLSFFLSFFLSIFLSFFLQFTLVISKDFNQPIFHSSQLANPTEAMIPIIVIKSVHVPFLKLFS